MGHLFVTVSSRLNSDRASDRPGGPLDDVGLARCRRSRRRRAPSARTPLAAPRRTARASPAHRRVGRPGEAAAEQRSRAFSSTVPVARPSSSAQRLRGLDEDRVVEQRQRLQRRVRDLAPGDAGLAAGAVEGREHRERGRALAERVQPAAVAVLALADLPGERRRTSPRSSRPAAAAGRRSGRRPWCASRPLARKAGSRITSASSRTRGPRASSTFSASFASSSGVTRDDCR